MTSTEIIADSPQPDLKPEILKTLPDFPLASQRCSLRLQQHLDLMLLALEALETGAAETMLQTARDLGLGSIIKNRLVFWRLRCTNPWRLTYNRGILNLNQAKALAILVTYRAKTLTVPLRRLLIAEQQMLDKGLPVDTNFLLVDYLERFRSHFASRMNPRRAKVSVYLASEEELNELALNLLDQLLFCTGTTGLQRFWISLFDGEVL